jgi:glycosyltransferase involved in cell wall biosynthesis
MKILFIARASLYRNRGGDTIQLHKTAEGLTRLGVVVDIRLADESIDYAGYDLLHFFNLMRPADILRHALTSGKPYVVSPLFVDYSEADRNTRKGVAKGLVRLVPSDRIEYLKVIARRVLNGERIVSPRYWWDGQRGSMRQILSRASLLLPNSESEYNRLLQRLGIPCPYQVVPNAIDPDIFRLPVDAPPREDDLVLCAGRIEGIKNQLNLVRAVNGSSFRLILVGAPALNQAAYYAECRKAAGPRITFINPVPQEELAAYYSRARVHALPSWFETTGLSSLEASAMGCGIVISANGDTREYFGDDACYCDPASPDSILEALKKAAVEGPSEALRTRILAHFTWAHTARKTLEAYQLAIGAPKQPKKP